MSDDDKRSILKNGFWAAALGGITSAVGALVALLMVLVLPVAEYGIYSYATSLAAIGMAVAQGGLASFAVKLLMGDKGAAPKTLGLIMATRATFALLGYLMIVAISLSSGTFPTIAAVLITGLALFARTGNAADFWYQSEMRNEVPSLIRIVVTVASLGVRILALWLWPSVWVFIALFVVEAIIGTGAVWIRFITDKTTPGVSRPGFGESLALSRQSMPLILAGLANQVNLRGDIVILQALSGSTAVGIYSVAARITDLAQVLPTAFMSATLPALIKARDKYGPADRRYQALLQRSYDQAFWLGVLFAVLVGAAGTAAITYLLSPSFAPAIPVLWLQLATCPFVFMALVYSKWIIAEGKLWLSLQRHTVGAVINISLNLILIPVLGLTGAALSTLASYIFASYLSCFLTAQSRRAGIQMSLAMLAPVRYLITLLRPNRTDS